MPRQFQTKLYSNVGSSLTDPLACALFKQETVVRATIQALLDAFAEKSELDPMLMLLLLLLLCFVAVIGTFCFSKAGDLTRPGQGPANTFMLI